MRRIIGRQIFDTETATQLTQVRKMTRDDGNMRLVRIDTLYVSPRGQRFVVRETLDGHASWAFRPVDELGVLRWLEEVEASEDMYAELGIQLEEA